MTSDRPKVYLGDGVYAVVRDGMLTLTTENGIHVHLEPEVWAALQRYMAPRVGTFVGSEE